MGFPWCQPERDASLSFRMQIYEKNFSLLRSLALNAREFLLKVQNGEVFGGVFGGVFSNTPPFSIALGKDV